MSMFSKESQAAIGLDRVRARWPHLTGKGVKLLQVEWDLARADHVAAVRDVIIEIAPEVELRLMSEKEYIKHLCGYFSMGLVGWYRWVSKPAEWHVENHSYTGRDADPVKAAALMDERCERENVLVYAASGNGLSDIHPLWHRSRKACICGTPSSPAGTYSMGTLYGTQPYPDLVVPTQWTSIAAPAMAACAALLRQAVANMVGVGMLWAPPVVNGVPRVDYWIADELGEPREVDVPSAPPPPPPVTWTEKRELMQILPGAWTPGTVEQKRTVTETWHIYELSSTGETRNARLEDIYKPEARTLTL